MFPLHEQVRRTLRRHAQAAPGSRVVVALSGGADSVALLHLLRELEPSCGFVVAGAAHLNHQLRGVAADLDERFCRDLAGGLGLPIVVDRIDVGALAATRRRSIEESGRDARYAFLGRAARQLDADRIAVGHTCDDQAETFLLRLLRGAGPRGLAGIRPRAGPVVRPLLEVTHADLRQYLTDRGLQYREDESNADTTIARNRVRHELLPLLEARFAPAIVDTLSREAAIALDDAAFLDQAAASAAAEVVTAGARDIEVEIAALLALPPAIGRRVLLRALEPAARGRFLGFRHAERLALLAAGRDGAGPIDFPGQRAVRRRGRLVLSRSRGDGRSQSPGMNFFRYSLSIPGEVVVAEAGCVLTAELVPMPAALAGAATGAARPADGRGPKDTRLAGRDDGDSREQPTEEPRRRGGPGSGRTWPAWHHTLPGWLRASRADLAAVDAACLPAELAVRSRQPGDRLQPLGLDGTKKLQDLFVDRKVPAERRNQVPLVVDDHDRIVWVAGHALADPFKVTSETKSMVILKLKDLGASD